MSCWVDKSIKQSAVLAVGTFAISLYVNLAQRGLDGAALLPLLAVWTAAIAWLWVS